MHAPYTLVDHSVTRPTIESILVKQTNDDDPDLSWLTQTDEQMGKGFEAASAERLDAYERGQWWMSAVFAQATILLPAGDGTAICQTIHSPGLHGIESDSDPDYLHIIGAEELDTLADMLTALGFADDAIAEARDDAEWF